MEREMTRTTPDTDVKAEVRATVFGHLAGMVVAPVFKALWDRRLFDLFESSPDGVDFEAVVERTHGNRGYLRIALRLLASCGWLEHQQADDGRESTRYALTEDGRTALRLAPLLYTEVLPFLTKAIFLEDFLFEHSDRPLLLALQELVTRSSDRWGR